MKTHTVSVSSAQFSILSMGSVLQAETMYSGRVQSRYHEALEIYNRVEGDHFLHTITNLVNIDSNYTKLKSYLNFNVVNKLTSLTERLQQLSGEMNELIRDDIENSAFGQLKVYRKAYSTYLQPRVDSLTINLQDAVAAVGQLREILMVWALDIHFDTEWAETFLKETLVVLTNVYKSLTLMTETNKRDMYRELDMWRGEPDTVPIYLESEASKRKNCTAAVDRLLYGGQSHVESLTTELSNDFYNLYNPVANTARVVNVLHNITIFSVDALVVADCFKDYNFFLEEVVTWVEKVKDEVAMQMTTFDSNYISSSLVGGANYVQALLEQYSDGTISKLELAEAVGNLTMKDHEKEITNIYNYVNENIVKAMQNSVQQMLLSATDNYVTGLRYAGRLQKYFNDSAALATGAHNMKIWLRPLPSIDSSEVRPFLN